MVKLYVDGHGLALTKFLLQRSTGSSWVSASKYETNHKYRFRVQFHNFYSDWIPSNNAACATSDIHIANLCVKLKLSGAKFSESGQSNTAVALTGRQIDGHPDFNDTIKPMKSRWFEFGDFTWHGPASAASSVAVEIFTFHREIYHYPFAPWGKLVATAT